MPEPQLEIGASNCNQQQRHEIIITFSIDHQHSSAESDIPRSSGWLHVLGMDGATLIHTSLALKKTTFLIAQKCAKIVLFFVCFHSQETLTLNDISSWWCYIVTSSTLTFREECVLFWFWSFMIGRIQSSWFCSFSLDTPIRTVIGWNSSTWDDCWSKFVNNQTRSRAWILRISSSNPIIIFTIFWQ